MARTNARRTDMSSSTVRTIAALAFSVGAVVSMIAYLVPPGSFPVGFDVFRSMWLAREYATSGMPSSIAWAAHTGLDERFADQQLGFDLLLALLCGKDIDNDSVPPLLYCITAVRLSMLWLAARWLCPKLSPLWILALPALSQVCLFRMTTLLSLSLASIFLYLLVAANARRSRGMKCSPWWLSLSAMGFGYCHGAFALVLFVFFVGICGARIEGRPMRSSLLDAQYVILGLLVAAIARPDFPDIVDVLFDLNLGNLVSNSTGELLIRPTELYPLLLDDLLRTEWTFLLGLAVLAFSAWRSRASARWSVILPALAMAVAAFASRRMFEIAAPLLWMAIATALGGAMRALVAISLFFVACVWHLPTADRGAEQNRIRDVAPAADWIAARANAGDVVFVTDFGASSPLAWHTRKSDLRFTGAIDPVFMWSRDPQAWHDYLLVKTCEAEQPLHIIERRFNARFIAFVLGDTAPGLPLGATASHIRKAIGDEVRQGRRVDAFVARPDCPRDASNWVVFDLCPP